MPCVAAVKVKTSLNFGGGPSPGESVQQCNAAEEHVVCLVATPKGGKVATIRQGHCSVTIAWAGCFSFNLRGVLSPFPCLSVQGVHLVGHAEAEALESLLLKAGQQCSGAALHSCALQLLSEQWLATTLTDWQRPAVVLFANKANVSV